MEHICPCGASFQGRANAKYCGPACRTAAARQRAKRVRVNDGNRVPRMSGWLSETIRDINHAADELVGLTLLTNSQRQEFQEHLDRALKALAKSRAMT